MKPWASVFVDGRNMGVTPLDTISLSDGTHAVRFVNPLFKPLDRTVTIRPGEEARLIVDLSKDAEPLKR